MALSEARSMKVSRRDRRERFAERPQDKAANAWLAPRDRSRQQRNDDVPQQLRRTIDDAIVPRLIMGNRPTPCSPEGISTADGFIAVEEVVDLTLRSDADVLTARLSGLVESGVAVETIYLELLAPAAHRLEARCAEDWSGGALVAVALSHLRCALHALAPTFYAEAEVVAGVRRTLVAPVPCATQICGAAMVDSFEAAMTAEFFRRAGWDVWSDNFRTAGDLLGVLKQHRFELVVLTTGCGSRLDALAELVPNIRRRTRNGHVAVLVGGRSFHEQPERALSVGADGTVLNGLDAVQQAERLRVTTGD